MRKSFLVCFFMLLTSCVADSISEQSNFVNNEEYQPNEVLEKDNSHKGINSCYYVGGITAFYSDDKEIFIYHPVDCLQPSESFPEIIPDISEFEFNNNEFDNNTFFENIIKESL